LTTPNRSLRFRSVLLQILNGDHVGLSYEQALFLKAPIANFFAGAFHIWLVVWEGRGSLALHQHK
jgi:hypothetical protein